MTTISNNSIAEAIYLGTEDKQGHELSLYFKNVVEFLARRNLLSKAQDILLQLEKIINNKEGIVSAKVWSATALASQTKHELTHSLKKRYQAKDVIMDEIVDANLLGGMKIEVNDEVIDLTIKNKMNKLQAYLTRPV